MATFAAVNRGGAPVAEAASQLPVPKRASLFRVPGDFPTPQDAFDSVQEGDCVFLSPQEFVLTEPMRISKTIHVMGESEMGERATLRYDGGTLQPTAPMLRTAASCRLQGLNFIFTCGEKATDSAKAVSRAIDVTCGDVLLSDCDITSSCGGINVGAQSYTSITNTKIRAKFIAVDVKGKCFIDRSVIDDFGAIDGVRVCPNGSLSAERSTIKGCDIGIDLGSLPNQILLKGLTITSCTTGIAVMKNDAAFPNPPEIKGNTISHCKRGIFTEGEGCVCDISKNLISQCSESGICITGGQSFLNANAIKNCPKYGIDVRKGKPQLSTNVLQYCKLAAVYCAGLHSLPVLLSNEISKCENVGVLVEEGAAPRVESNLMTENRKNILVKNALGLYKKNELLVSEEESISIEGDTSNVVIEENEILGSVTSCGVCVFNQANAIVASNTFAGTKLTSIVLKGCGATEVVDNEMDPATCQAGAVVAQQRAVAKIYRNHTNGLAVTVFSDSQDTAVSDEHE